MNKPKQGQYSGSNQEPIRDGKLHSVNSFSSMIKPLTKKSILLTGWGGGKGGGGLPHKKHAAKDRNCTLLKLELTISKSALT